MPEHGSPAPRTESPTRIIALINQKGGVGKTTTTVNLGAALAASGRSTLIVDLDPQAHATLSLGVDPRQAARTVYDLLLDWDDNPASAVVQVRPNLALVPSETDLAAAEAELTQEQDRHRRLARALAALSGKFQAILIDCPPSLGMLTINALAAANEVIIPMQAHFLALQGVGKLLETVKLVRAKINPGLTVSGAVICMHDTSATHTQEVVTDIESFFTQARGKGLPWSGAQVFKPSIRRNIKLAECPSFGQTIFDYAPLAPGAADYRALAESVFAPRAAPVVEQPPAAMPKAIEPKPAKARPPKPAASPAAQGPSSAEQPPVAVVAKTAARTVAPVIPTRPPSAPAAVSKPMPGIIPAAKSVARVGPSAAPPAAPGDQAAKPLAPTRPKAAAPVVAATQVAQAESAG